MKQLLALVIACIIAAPLAAEEVAVVPEQSIFVDGTDVDLNEFLWKNRPLVIFADSEFDQRFVRQMELLNARLDELAERDVVILTDTDPSAQSPLRERLRPRGFMLALIVKDGTIYLRKPFPWDVREITRTIDKLPMRQQEIRERREAG
ncbi:DUF4174 domain-containing protein [Pseudohalocynthiibacter aestuariivivens]|uniref:DUF4174 domain-containing protein n=1 Tax=Roseovarius pelagicus TaxID=2980108 RepID=A0ABY6DDA1_9RHOB|nr:MULTISPECIES: DUF4174 domain-containing protein [Rhodobacterales]QIE47355.1 DUF4174 domain-containing protein [Pseudohalocynthiibacter aestuariivivens]UXX84083.1 DUF4174 domain-containing protein [Roseovarius pelagicus]